MPVHMRGIPSRMDAIMEIARRHNLLVIPGVGHFSSCLAQLRRSGLEEVLTRFIAEQRPSTTSWSRCG